MRPTSDFCSAAFYVFAMGPLLLSMPAAAGTATSMATTAAPAPSMREEFAAIAGGPYTTAVTAATASDTVAWVTTRAGTISVWVASAPAYRARQLEFLDGDTGDVIDDLVLSPNGQWLAYARGPSAAPNGRTPNPAGLVDGLERALWLTATSGATAGHTAATSETPPMKLAIAASGLAFAPDSRRFVYIRGGQPQLIEINGAPGAAQLSAPKSMFKDFGDVAKLAWSPAGDVLAFISERPAHSVVGLYRLGEDRVHYLAPSVFRDRGIAWSADGRRLAFLRLPGVASSDIPDVMKNSRFSIWVANATGTQAEEIYRSPGLDAGLSTEESLHWLRDGTLVVLSDTDGYSHLYSIDPATHRVTQLSHGQCDEESVAVSANGANVALSGNCFDQSLREVATRTQGSTVWTRVSDPQSVATDPAFVGTGDTLLYRSATYDRAQSPVLLDVPGHERLLGEAAKRASDSQRKASALRLPETIRLTAPDGTPLTAVWFAPRNVPRGARAAGVVYVHGGPIRQMMPAWDMNAYYAYAYAANQLLAQHGIGVLAINYRTGVGFGRAFRSAAHYGPNGSSELQDVIAAGAYLRSRPEIDPARIGIYGGSYGGQLTANALAHRSDLFKAGVAWHGIYDFTQWITNEGHPDRLPAPWGATEATRALAFQSSALSQISSWRSPTLLISGDDDRNVDFAETVTLYRALDDAGAPVEAYVLPNEVHGFLRFDSWIDVIDRTVRFLIDHLR